MKASYSLSLLLLLVPLLLAGCKGGEPKGTAEKDYSIKGKVIAVDLAKPSVKLDHEDVPGLMKGMAMEFAVQDPKVLEGLGTGDQVQGRLKVESGKYTITQLEKR